MIDSIAQFPAPVSLFCLLYLPLILCFAAAIEGSVTRIFGMAGYVIARFPILFLVGATLMAVGLSMGILRVQRESQVEKLWMPPNSQSILDRSYIRATFGRSARVASVILFD